MPATKDADTPTRPNILLITTDQQRGDCLGIDGHPCLETPHLDALAASGSRFSAAYSTCPSCIPARRSLLSGQFPSTHGLVGFRDGVRWQPAHTLPGKLGAAGYQTFLAGRTMHQYPPRKRFGYDHMVLAGDINSPERDRLASDAHGLTGNGWTARPWHLDEAYHSTNRVTEEAIRFIRNWRDPSCPFFLTVSYFAPHPPLCPPQCYFDRYLRRDVPQPAVGDWAEPPAEGERGTLVDSDRVQLTGPRMHEARAGYYGLINHIDDQISRVLSALGSDRMAGWPTLENTIVVFTSDHGEMLGDHHLYRKAYPYEGSARVPMIIRLPESMRTADTPAGQVRREPVCLEDFMPTLLELAGVAVPDTVDGRSLAPLLHGQNPKWRAYLHGEHAACYGPHHAHHYLTNGRQKYIWYPHTGTEQLFDLTSDPEELHELSRLDTWADTLHAWRNCLIDELRDRPEGFTDGTRLIAGRAFEPVMPGVAAEPETSVR